MVEITVIESTKINYRGSEMPLFELPRGMYSLQLKLNHPSYPFIIGDGNDVAERIFKSDLNRNGTLNCQELIVDEVEHPNMFRFEGEVD